jgi:rod shape-determining protein MreC
VANGASGKAYATYSGVTDYFYLRRFSDSLVAENASLRAQLKESKYDTHIDSLKKTDTIGRYIQNYTFLTARVIHVTKYMGVVNSNGIVGLVTNVTEHYCAVRSVLSKDFKISGRFKKNGTFGNLHWEGMNSGTATMDEIPKHVPVQVGDTVVTSGFSESFPRNIMIGVVKKVTAEPEKPFFDITVKLSTNFGNLDYVYLVNDLRKNESLALDSLTKKND